MKILFKTIALFLVSLLLFAACGPKPQYKTRKGKKKLDYYNSIQYDSGKQHKNKDLKKD